MVCQHCGKKNSSLKITRIEHGHVSEIRVCDDCAALVSHYHAKLTSKSTKQTVESLLKDLLEQSSGAPVKGVIAAIVEVESGLVCENCGLDFARYKKTFMLGCPECYDHFGERLLTDIQRIHGATEHVASLTETPQAELIDRQSRARLLRTELDDCLDREDYARAARIRDELKALGNAEGVAGP